MTVPVPTPIYRFLHVDNLRVLLEREAIHAPNHTPNDGRPYKTIHNVDIQQQRQVTQIPCGPGGVIHDYVSFYLGPRSPMLLQLHTDRVDGYREGQDPLIYVVSWAQLIERSGTPFVFSDGHGIAFYTRWFDDLKDLDKVDWVAAYAAQWADTVDEMDRQRRKQAEFLVYRQCDWTLIGEIAVVSEAMKANVEQVLAGYSRAVHRPVLVQPGWYY